MASQDVQELKLLFALFDTDNSGTLTREELKLLLQSPHADGGSVSEDKVAEYLNAADTDGSGDVSLDEFIVFFEKNISQGSYGLKSIFRTIDTNGDGSVEKSEFEQAKTTNKDLNSNLIKILDKIFDSDASSKVTYEQFVQGVNDFYQK